MIHRGYTSETVWIKFNIKNDSDQALNKVLVLDNQMLDHIHFFTKENNKYKKQILGVLNNRTFNENILDFYFNITLNPKEQKEYYLKVSSLSCAVYFKLELMDTKELYTQEINHQLILTLFFGAMVALMVYNIFIYTFTKDIAYIYYVLYLFFTIWNHGSYTGLSVYIIQYLPKKFIEIDAYLAIFYLSFMTIFILLFTRSFLNIKNYKRIDIIFKILILIGGLLIVFTSKDFYPIDLASLLLLVTLIIMIGTSYYLFIKKEVNAKFFIIGWTLVIIAWIMQGLEQYGFYSVNYNYKYFYEFTIFAEAILFSIALSSRLNKTKELEVQVKRNDAFTRELHHRVKNNMQFIISLYRMKLGSDISRKIDSKLKDIENSIKAMSNIHEILYDDENIENIDANKYFANLTDAIKDSYRATDININMNCTSSLDIQKAIYCGIILNELITNSLKYAFLDT